MLRVDFGRIAKRDGLVAADREGIHRTFLLSLWQLKEKAGQFIVINS